MTEFEYKAQYFFIGIAQKATLIFKRRLHFEKEARE